jgi:hypothetical protein
MKELGLQELLRYALSGGIFIASVLMMYPSAACSVGRIDGAREATLILGSVLLVGTLIYNFHRALLYPVLFRPISLLALPFTNRTWWLFFPWRPSKAELDIDHWRWSRTPEHRRRWDEWGAQTHFLYCAAWAMLASLWVGKYVEGPPNYQVRYLCWILFGVSLFAGVVNNYRLLYSINEERKLRPL